MQENRKKPFPSPLCSPQISWTDPVMNTVHHGNRPATNHLSHGAGKVRPRTGHEDPEGSRGIALLFL